MKYFAPNRGKRAFTLIELIVIIFCVVMLGALVVGGLSRAREQAHSSCCNCNLKQIGLSFRTWSGDHEDRFPMSVSTNKGGSLEWASGPGMFRHFQVMSNELNNPIVLVCPRDNRKPAKDFTNFSNTNLSYFAAFDGDETYPAMPLAGDWNLTKSNLALGPGLAVFNTSVDIAGWSKKLHKERGNLGICDGSVQNATSAGLQLYFQRSGTNVLRLAIP